MWSAKYTNVDKSGLQPELIVSVEFSNDVDVTTYIKVFTVMPVDLDSDGFNSQIQAQVDILNAKDAFPLEKVTAVLGKAISVSEVKVAPLSEENVTP